MTASTAAPSPAAPQAAPKRLLKVLHVGVSNRGVWPLKKCNADTGFQSAALCDVSPAALAGARQITGLPESACFTNYDEALAKSDVDCVIICAPTMLHVPLTAKAIDAGLPVLVEKGMAPDWAGATGLVRAAQERNAKVAVAQNYRYNAHEKTVARAIRDPAADYHTGPVHLLTCAQNRVRPVPRTLTYPFASVWDMSCHHFDNLLSWLGPIAEMTAFSWRAHWSAYEHDNNTTAQIVFRDGTNVDYIHTHDAARASMEVQVHGERGALFWRESEMTFSQRPLEQFGTRPSSPVPLEPSQGEGDLLHDFHRYVTAGVEPGVSARNNLEVMAACEMMVRSITQRRTIRREELDQ